ncbi:cell division protein SepF [Vagococcus sp. JNUCC 83]
MKIFNKAGERFSDFFGVSGDDTYVENEPFVDEDVEEITIDKEPVVSKQSKTTLDKTHENIIVNEESRASESSAKIAVTQDIKVTEPENQYTNEKIVEMNTYQPTSNGNKRMVVARQHRKVTVYEPRDYIDCKQIAQALFRKEIIILSFRLMDEHPARRVVDFMTGAVYAIDGDIQRLGDDIFICTPANVDVDSSITRNIITNHLTEY